MGPAEGADEAVGDAKPVEASSRLEGEGTKGQRGAVKYWRRGVRGRSFPGKSLQEFPQSAEGEMTGHAGPGRVEKTGLPGPARTAVTKAALGNIAVLAAGVGVASLMGRPMAVAYASGYILGAVNIFWLFRIAGRGLKVPKEKVARFVAIRYYLRFIITALVFMALITKVGMSPVPLLAGLTASVLTTIVVMILVAKKEAS